MRKPLKNQLIARGRELGQFHHPQLGVKILILGVEFYI